MERRFTARDLTLVLGLTLIALLLVLLMYQVDRQWNRMSEMQRAMQEQAEDLRRVRVTMQGLERRVQEGGLATRGAGTETGEVPEAFRRAHAATLQEGYAQGDWLVRAFGTGLSTISPLVSTDAYASEVQGYVLESLLTRDPDSLEWQGLIARDWTISEDGLTITFRMRPDVTFSDGVPMTAEDVVFSSTSS
jgi:peptide/nickel transport system substrate-binding protein